METNIQAAQATPMTRALTPAQLTFDYSDSGIEPADARQLEKHAETVLSIQDRQRRSTVENALRLGEELAAAQSKLSNHGNGTFGKWCKERLGFNVRTAERLIVVHEGVPLKDRDTVSQTFDLSALYYLLADTAPEEAYRDALKIAKKGEHVSAKDAKTIIQKHTLPDESDEPGEPDEPDEPDEPAEAMGPAPFDLAEFMRDTRRHVREWAKRCQPGELPLIIEELRDLASQLERRVPDAN